MVKRNEDIRKCIRQAGLYTWQVAEAYGVTDTYFYSILRRELDPGTREKIHTIIDRLKKEAV